VGVRALEFVILDFGISVAKTRWTGSTTGCTRRVDDLVHTVTTKFQPDY